MLLLLLLMLYLGTPFETSRGTLMQQQGTLLEGLASGRIEAQRDRQVRYATTIILDPPF